MRSTSCAITFTALLATGCGGGNNNPSVECKDTADCNLSAGGACMVNPPTGNKWCAYPSADCPSGYRWSSFGTGDGVAGTCVAPPDAPPAAPILTVNVGGSGTGRVVSTPIGIDCPGVCSSTFASGTKVTLDETPSATPNQSTFLGWSDGCTGDGPCVVTINGNTKVGALFGIPGSNVWLRQLHSSTAGTVFSAKVGASGDVVIGGTFSGTMMPGTSTYNASNGDAFAAKLAAADGTPIWVKQFGGTGLANVYGVDVDGNGDVIVAGAFQGTANFGNGNVTSAGDYDVFVAKLSGTNGNYIWSKTFGGTGKDLVALSNGVSFDPQGNVYVAGTFNNSIKPGTTTITSAGSSDAFIVKYDSNGNHVWSKGIGGTDYEEGDGLSVDGSGNVVITGVFASTTINFGGGAISNKGGTDIYVAKYAAANGNYLVARGFGTVNDDISVGGVAVDTAGNMYVTGMFDSSHTLDVGGPTPLTGHGQYDVFLVKYSIAGAHVWSEALGNQYPDQPFSIHLDSAGEILLAATFNGSVSYGTGPILSSAGGADIILAELSTTDGSHVASVRLGGTGDDQGYVAVGAPNFDVFCGGFFTGFAEFGGQSLNASTGTSTDGYSLLLQPLN